LYEQWKGTKQWYDYRIPIHLQVTSLEESIRACGELELDEYMVRTGWVIHNPSCESRLFSPSEEISRGEVICPKGQKPRFRK